MFSFFGLTVRRLEAVAWKSGGQHQGWCGLGSDPCADRTLSGRLGIRLAHPSLILRASGEPLYCRAWSDNQGADMSSKKALVVWGGWNGHTPQETAELLAGELKAKGVAVTIETTLDSFADQAKLETFDLIVPNWTMGKMTDEQWKGLNAAVKNGVGLGGIHGGMGDAFSYHYSGYAWMVGGHFSGHPYVGEYTVQLSEESSPITKGMPRQFTYKSEQYYMMLDPAIRVLAYTMYDFQGEKVRMPVVWTRTWGKGKVFFSALGHTAAELKQYPDVVAMTVRGLLWAAR
jgi:hypothetical protein